MLKGIKGGGFMHSHAVTCPVCASFATGKGLPVLTCGEVERFYRFARGAIRTRGAIATFPKPRPFSGEAPPWPTAAGRCEVISV